MRHQRAQALLPKIGLKLDRAWIVYPGNETYPVHERVEAVSLDAALNALARIAKSV